MKIKPALLGFSCWNDHLIAAIAAKTIFELSTYMP
jgi:hypothetical protein